MALNNFIGKRRWKTHFEAGREAMAAGDLQAAESSLRSALEQAVNISERDSSYGDTALLLGQLYRRTSRLNEADEMSRKAFDYYESIFGVTDPRTIEAHLAIVLSMPSRSHDSPDVRKATYELARSQFGDKSWQAVRTSGLALASFSSQEREKVLADVQAACAAVLAEDRVNLSSWPPVAEEFATALSLNGYEDLAARFMGIQLRLNEERFGEKSLEAGIARLNLGELLLRSGNAAKAEFALTRALEQLKLKLGPQSPEVQQATVSLARALAQQKKLGQAAPHLTSALGVLGSHQVEERLEVIVALLEQKCLIAGTDSERGALWQELESLWERARSNEVKSRIFEGLLAAQGRLQQSWELQSADRFLHAVLARVRKWRGPHHPDVAHVMMELCSCCIASDDKAKGKSFLDQSLALDEGVDNSIRAVHCLARLGETATAQQHAEKVKRLFKNSSTGVELGRRQARLASSLLACGDLDAAYEYATLAERQLPESEQLGAQCTLARVRVLQGKYSEAISLFESSAPRLTDPYKRTLAFLHLAWLFVRTGQFSESKEALRETELLFALRPEHPVLYQVKAVQSQIAFYTGQVFEGLELRKQVLNFIKSGRHEQTLRSLQITVLLEPFGPDEEQTELEVGTQILAATEFPQRSIAVFPTRDVACSGLRHITRALHHSGQTNLAQERAAQYKERFLSLHPRTSPLLSSVYLVDALVAENASDKVTALEAALPGLRTLSPTHVSIFATLSRLAELCAELGRNGRALDHARAALELKNSSKLTELVERIENASVEREPSLESEPEPTAHEPQPVNYDSAERPTIQDERPGAAGQGQAMHIIAAGGASDLAELQLARFLSERAEAPTPAETVEFLQEVKARFGQEVQPNLEARLLLALLFPDGAEEATQLWKDALALLPDGDNVDLVTIENRARDAGSWTLVVQTLEERLRRESDRYGENAVETLETQMKLARALESKGLLGAAYRRLTLVAEILRSWFGARSRRLLEPLAELIRMAEKGNDIQAAFEHQLERHRLLEAADGDAEELFNSRASLLPIRGRLGQFTEVLEEAAACEKELLGFRSNAASEFVNVLLTTAQRVDQIHWRSDVAATLLEIALRTLPENEVSLGCRVRIALAENLCRKDYRSQAKRLRTEALDKAGSLDADARAEMLHLAARSCLRIQEVGLARDLADRILEERLAQGGRKDIWAGRALLIIAEADLKTYRLEGTETAIGMSAASLEGTRFWARAQSLQIQALFFLNRFKEAYGILEKMDAERALDLHLKLAVWRGQTTEWVREFAEESGSLLSQRWANFESLPLDRAVNILEFLARAGQVRMMSEGLDRIRERLKGVLQTDIRFARIKIVSACLQFWKSDWDRAASTLQRTIELVPPAYIEFPEGLTSNVIREAMLTCFLQEGRSSSALAQAQQGVAEAAELLGEEDIRAIAFRIQLAECAQSLGQLNDALLLLDEILGPLQDVLGETHIYLRGVYRGLARTFLGQEDIESARMSAEEALRIDKECRGLSIHFLQDLELLAEIESKEDIPEALNVLETALELSEQILPANHPYAESLSQKREVLETREVENLAVLPEDELEVEVEVEPEPEAEVEAEVEAEPEVEPEAEAALPEPEPVQPQAEVLAESDSPESLFDLAPEVAVVEDQPDEVESPEMVDSAEFLFEPVTVEPEETTEDPVPESVKVDPVESLFEPMPETFEVEAEDVSDSQELHSADVLFAEPERVSLFDDIEPVESEDDPESAPVESAERDDADGRLDDQEEDEGEFDDAQEFEAESVESAEVEEVEESEEDSVASEETDPVEESREGDGVEEEAEGFEADSAEVAEPELAEADEPEPEAVGDSVEESDQSEEDAVEPEADAVALAEPETAEPETAEPEVAEFESVEAEPEPEAVGDSVEESDESGDSDGTEEAVVEPEADAEPEVAEPEVAEPEVAEAEAVEAEAEGDSVKESENGEDVDHDIDEVPLGWSSDSSHDFHPPSEPEVPAEEAPSGETPRPYRVSAVSKPGTPVSSGASVETLSDFPEVPLRLPFISEVEETEADAGIPVDSDGQEAPEESLEGGASLRGGPVSVEEILDISDPEGCLLPLAPVFFLPVPWKEATEAPFDSKFDAVYRRFQSAYSKNGDWRPMVESAVSTVRLNPETGSGYFLFLIGAQLEKGGHLHTADVCLATAIELLESGPALGAACHLAGRVAGRRGELNRALEYFERSAELAGEAELAVLKIDAAECHLGMGRPEEALLGFEEVFEYLAENVPKVQALAVQAKMAQIHLLIGDPDASQALAEETYQNLSPKNAGTYRVLGRILLSRAFARLGRHELALELAEKAWEGAQGWSAKRKDGRRIAISNLVDIYCLCDRFEDAQSLVQESGLTGWGLSEAELLLRAGHVACALGNLVDARTYIRLGRSFLERFRSPSLWRSCFLELEAEVSLNEGDFKRATLMSELALEMFEREATGPVDRSRHIVRAAKIAGARGDIETALDLVEQAYSLRDLHLGANHPHTSSVEGLTAVLSGE